MSTVCGFCDGVADPLLSAVDLNRQAGAGQFDYSRCRACGTVSLVNVPSNLGVFYPDGYSAYLSRDELAQAGQGEAVRVASVRRHVQSGRLVEIGPGNGAFAFAARQVGYDVTVIDRDRQCCESLAENAGVQAIHSEDPASALASLPPSRAVVMWHVIEHLHEPARMLDVAAANLEPGGVLAIATPNPESLQFRLFRSRWVHLDAPRHLALIPVDAMSARLRASGLRRVDATTSDPTGRAITRAGWGRVVPGGPAGRVERGRPNRVKQAAVRFGVLGLHGLETCARPLEGTGFRGAAYSALFVRDERGKASADRLR